MKWYETEWTHDFASWSLMDWCCVCKMYGRLCCQYCTLYFGGRALMGNSSRSLSIILPTWALQCSYRLFNFMPMELFWTSKWNQRIIVMRNGFVDVADCWLTVRKKLVARQGYYNLVTEKGSNLKWNVQCWVTVHVWGYIQHNVILSSIINEWMDWLTD